ncbi:MAG TPA: hypothetical protein DGT21_02825 [Armatimonadetes bacterium]|nr:hypothetical protein [Armatimonadota bacterium]
MTEDAYAETVATQADNYEFTIQALICLDAAIRYETQREPKGYVPGSHFLPGRRMTPMTSGGVANAAPVTPDIVIQMPDAMGMVGDVKLTASSKRDFGQAEAQIARYDTDLAGWCTSDECGLAHDLLLLVHYANGAEAEEHFSRAHYGRAFALVTVVRDLQRHCFMTYELRLGRLSRDEMTRKLRKPLPVPLERLAAQHGRVKFYDARPECVEYTMDVLWHEYFPQVVNASEHRRVDRRNATVTQRRVDVRSARECLQDAYSTTQLVAPENRHRQPETPQLDWVREAMEGFVEIGRAERDHEDEAVYWVTYSARARNTNAEGFARQLHRSRKKRRSASRTQGQMSLPLDQ